ncbi:DUF1573 domain-containing protein [Ruficoccus sp. ZRK36]|nr:DUF1573 domain-containing protein [Ruficoccus sp. ZRK36]
MTVPVEVGQEQAVGVYAFKNTGNEPVTILDIHSNCGCTVPELEKKTYEPGESGEIKAIFTLGDRTGPQRKVLTVNADMPGHPITRLVLEANIPKLMTIAPRILIWRKGAANENKEIYVTTDPANSISIEKNADGYDAPWYELVPDEDKPGRYVVLVHPESTEVSKKLKFLIVVTTPEGKQVKNGAFILVR